MEKEKVEKIRKSLLGVSLSSLVIVCVMCVLAVFKVPIFSGIPLRILLCLSAICVASGLTLSEMIVIHKNKILGFIGLGLLGLSTILALICFCSNLLVTYTVYNRITGIVAILSVAYTGALVVYSRLGRHLLWLQIVTYFAIGLWTGFITLIIAGRPILEAPLMLQVFIVVCIICLGSFVACNIIGVRLKGGDEELSKMGIQMVRIEKTELDNLKMQISSLQDENAFLKKEIETLKNKNGD